MAALATSISPPRPTARRAAPIPVSPGIERTLVLRLKLIADAGLIGLPNAGKSTFLAAVSAAKPKIADYPFTTLHPGLGVVRIDGRDFVLADIPGLIEGAHEGHGLGDRFLGHVERCGAIVHLVDATGENAGADYRTVRRELAAYGEGLAEKTEIVALSKVDAVDEAALKKQTERLVRVIREFGPPLAPGAKRAKPLMLSTATRAGVTEVLRATMAAIEARRDASELTESKPVRPNGRRRFSACSPLLRERGAGVRVRAQRAARGDWRPHPALRATFSRREKGGAPQSSSLRASSGSMIGTPSRIG